MLQAQDRAHHHAVDGDPAVAWEVLKHGHQELQAAIPVAEEQHHADEVADAHDCARQVVGHVEDLGARQGGSRERPADPWSLVRQQWEDAVLHRAHSPSRGRSYLLIAPTPPRPFKVMKCPRLENVAPYQPAAQAPNLCLVGHPLSSLRTTASSSDPVPTHSPPAALSPSWKVLVTLSLCGGHRLQKSGHTESRSGSEFRREVHDFPS